tara:strand:- start:145 stop:312 length:168 start_codon:yes stop_codon:yes gene_type:complete
MKKFSILLFLCSCNFVAENNSVDIKYLDLSNMSVAEYKISLKKKNKDNFPRELKK